MLNKQELITRLNRIEDPVKRRTAFVGLLSREIVRVGGKEPIIVGGEAVEIYTQGGYTTGDIDIITTPDQMAEILSQWGFICNEGNRRLWFSEDMDIFVDWRGAGLAEGTDSEKRANSVIVDKELKIKVISLEDLIVDRLCAAKFWQDIDSSMWASVLYGLGKNSLGIDADYLEQQARKAKVSDLIKDLDKST